MTLSEKQKKFVYNKSLLIQFAYKNGFELTDGEAYRPPEMQKIYFDTGRSKTMVGRHPDRLAQDYNIFYQGRLLFQDKTRLNEDLNICKILGDYWVSLHTDNRWGGDFNRNNDAIDDKFHDPYHFQMDN